MELLKIHFILKKKELAPYNKGGLDCKATELPYSIKNDEKPVFEVTRIN
jgi:hypothetical protein